MTRDFASATGSFDGGSSLQFSVLSRLQRARRSSDSFDDTDLVEGVEIGIVPSRVMPPRAMLSPPSISSGESEIRVTELAKIGSFSSSSSDAPHGAAVGEDENDAWLDDAHNRRFMSRYVALAKWSPSRLAMIKITTVLSWES